MPRSARTDSVQNAFINLGAANQRYSNIVLNQRNRQRSERGQIGGIAGGIIGGKFGGPAGAAAGSAIGAKILGGDVQDGRTGANIGVAVANQQNQAEQQEQQQRSIAALQGARKDAANQRVIETGEVVQPSFFTSFKEAQPEQQPPQFIAAPQTETPQQGNVGFQDIFPRPNGNQAVVSSIPEIDVQRSPEVPANNLTQVSQNEQPNIGLSTLETAPLASTGRVTGVQPTGTPFQQFINQGEQQLAIEQAALNDPRLSRFPSAFAAQQQTVSNLQNQINQAKFQFARMREAQPVGKRTKFFRVEDEQGGILFPALTAAELQQKTSTELIPTGAKVFEVGRATQPLRRESGDSNSFTPGKAFGEIRKLEDIQEIDAALEDERLKDFSSLEFTRIKRQADQRKTQISEKNVEPIKKDITSLNRKNYSEEKVLEIKSQIDALEQSKQITPEVAEKYKQRINKRENEVINRISKRALSDKQMDKFNNSFQLGRSLDRVMRYESYFKDLALKVPVERAAANFRQRFGSSENPVQEAESALANLQLVAGNSMVKGVISDADQEKINKALVNLKTAPESAKRILNDIFQNAKQKTILEKENLNRSKDFGSSFMEQYNDFIQRNYSQQVQTASPASNQPVSLSRQTIGNISAGQKVRLPNGKIVVATQDAINKFKQQNKIK